MEKVYLYSFIDNDNADTLYHLVAKEDCGELIESIERFYYDFDDYETIDELVEYLKEHKADKRLIDYVSKQEDAFGLTCDGISTLTYEVLYDLGVLISYDERRFNY